MIAIWSFLTIIQVVANDSSIELPNIINKYCYFQTFVGSSDCDASVCCKRLLYYK